MFFSKYILPLPFFIAIFVGFLMCYITAPEPKIVCKHPTPHNVDKHIYNHEDDVCYKYEVDEVQCPNEKKQIKETPVEFKCDKKNKD